MAYTIQPTDQNLRGDFAKYPTPSFKTSDDAWAYIEESADSHADAGFTEFQVVVTQFHNGQPLFDAFCENDGEVIVENRVTGQRLALSENALDAILNYAIEEGLVKEA